MPALNSLKMCFRCDYLMQFRYMNSIPVYQCDNCGYIEKYSYMEQWFGAEEMLEFDNILDDMKRFIKEHHGNRGFSG